jgi:hypothetical protein
MVAVRTFPLSRRYSPALFSKVRVEVERVAKQLQQQLGATLSGRIVTVAGERAWQYDLAHGDQVEELTFVLRGKTEYELYCRRAKSDSSAPCVRLVSSFKPR